MNEKEYKEGLAIIREDSRNNLHLNPIHCTHDASNADWAHWKKMTKLYKAVCTYEREHNLFSHINIKLNLNLNPNPQGE